MMNISTMFASKFLVILSLTFYVKDNGLGIEEKYHEDIFALFRRLHSRKEFKGTGAGLTIAKKIVESHGGRIWLQSSPGRGSTFFVSLPRAETKPTKPARVKTPPHFSRNISIPM